MADSTKLQRQLDLLALLITRRFAVRPEEIMEGVPAYADQWKSGDPVRRDSTKRMFERDKEDLRKLGIPLRTVAMTIDTEPTNGYIIEKRDFYLPYLKLLNEGEEPQKYQYMERSRPANVDIHASDAPLALNALRRVAQLPAFPFADAARSAFRKLAFDLDPHVFATGAPVLFLERPGSAELRERVHRLADALIARKRIRFRYRGIYRGEVTERTVDAHGMLFQHGHWYLIGYDAMRDDVRVFRVARMEDIVANRLQPNSPDYEIPADFSLDRYVGREPWELGEPDEQPLRAEVLFRFPQSMLAERNGWGELLEKKDDGGAVRVFELHQVNPFLRWVLSFDGEAEIVAPVELREELRQVAREIAQKHRVEVELDG